MIADAIIAAAGTGERLGLKAPKAFVEMGGKPIIAHAIEVFQSSSRVDKIAVVIPSGFEVYCRDRVAVEYDFNKVSHIGAGGARRQESIYIGLKMLINEGACLVAVHDAARPLLSLDLLERTIDAAEVFGAAIAALPMVDSLKCVESSDIISGTRPRQGLWRAQTPQVFRKDLLLKAHEAALSDGFFADDDSELVERLGHKVRVVRGSPFNIKITTIEDVELAAKLMGVRFHI